MQAKENTFGTVWQSFLSVSYQNNSTPKQLIRAAVYARVSTKPQAGEDKISIADQIRECRKSAAANNWTIVGEFVDPGISANTIERPGLKKLLESPSGWDLVIAWDFDRFYRDKRSVAGYILDNTPMLLNDDNLPEILTARELETFIRLDVKTIYAYVKGGRIPYVRMGSNLRFCKREILAWLEERHYRP